jgi:putative endonuclease
VAEVDGRQAWGNVGESLASDELRRLGYAILATRYRSRFGEIDIVSIRDGVIGFVEVKTRRRPLGDSGSSAIDAVHPRKQRRIAAMALDYLAANQQLDAPCRFIVVAIDGLGTPRQTVRVVEDAWESDSLY